MYDKNPPEHGGFVSNLGRPHVVARNMFTQICYSPHKFMKLLVCSGDHTGSPLRVYAEIHKKLIHSKSVCTARNCTTEKHKHENIR